MLTQIRNLSPNLRYFEQETIAPKPIPSPRFLS